MRIVSDIHDVAMIEADAIDLQPRDDVEATALILTAARHAGGGAAVFDLDLEAAQDRLIWTDLDRAMQILVNLMSNAKKYSLGEGDVTVIASFVDDAYLRVSVSDQGIGISDDMKPKIFNAFEREDRAVRRAISGAGLGLSIAKRLADRLDARIDFESEEGVGSTFWVDFPLRKPAQP